MPRNDYRFLPEDSHPYFLTAATVNWLPLFSNPEIAQILLDSFMFLIEQRSILIYAYVIMENHIHFIASGENLAKEVANFKSFTARQSIDFYSKNHNDFILDQLAFHKLAHKKDRPYQFWQEGSHPQRVISEDMMRQKIEYIHANPVRRGYVDVPEHWRYSSAGDYLGIDGLLPVCLEW